MKHYSSRLQLIKVLNKLEEHLRYEFKYDKNINVRLSCLNDVYSPLIVTRLHNRLINPLFNFK